MVMLSLLFFDFFDDFLGASDTEPDGECLGVASLLQKKTQALNQQTCDVLAEPRRKSHLFVEPAELIDAVLSGVLDMLRGERTYCLYIDACKRKISI